MCLHKFKLTVCSGTVGVYVHNGHVELTVVGPDRHRGHTNIFIRVPFLSEVPGGCGLFAIVSLSFSAPVAIDRLAFSPPMN